MTGNEKFDNDVGRVNTRLAFLARKHSDQKESMVLRNCQKITFNFGA